MEIRSDNGFLFEGFILSELLKSGKESIKFWQDKNAHEVDILLENAAIEIKFKTSLKEEDFIGLEAFSKEYKYAKDSYLINLGVQKKKGKISLKLPYWLDFV